LGKVYPPTQQPNGTPAGRQTVASWVVGSAPGTHPFNSSAFKQFGCTTVRCNSSVFNSSGARWFNVQQFRRQQFGRMTVQAVRTTNGSGFDCSDGGDITVGGGPHARCAHPPWLHRAELWYGDGGGEAHGCTRYSTRTNSGVATSANGRGGSEPEQRAKWQRGSMMGTTHGLRAGGSRVKAERIYPLAWAALCNKGRPAKRDRRGG